jgi:hypothetical protein
MGHASHEPWAYGPQHAFEIEEDEARQRDAEALAHAQRHAADRTALHEPPRPQTLTMAEAVARLRTMHAEVVASAARPRPTAHGYWQQEKLVSIASKLQDILALYEEDGPTTAPAFVQDCGCSKEERCKEAWDLYDALRRANHWRDTKRGRRIQLAVQYANHLYDLRMQRREQRAQCP